MEVLRWLPLFSPTPLSLKFGSTHIYTFLTHYKINSSFCLFAKVASQVFTDLGPASWIMGGNPKLTAFVLAGDGTVSRVIWDAKRGVYTGYDIAVKPDPRNRTAQVWIQPLSLSSEQIAEREGPRWNLHWSRLNLPSYYSLQSVKFDSPILVTLWSDASSKAVDHVVVRQKRRSFVLRFENLVIDRHKLCGPTHSQGVYAVC